jgi:hypothetical protein
MKYLRLLSVFSIIGCFALFPMDEAKATCVTTAQSIAAASSAAATLNPADTATVEAAPVIVQDTCGGDDVSYQVSLPNAINFEGTTYNAVYATTNSTIVFGRQDNDFANFPRTPSISVNAYDWVVLNPANPNPTNSYPAGWRAPDEHLIITSSQAGFQVDLAVRPYGVNAAGTPLSTIVVTAAINADNTLTITYLSDIQPGLNTRTGVRLPDGRVVTLEEAGFTRVYVAPVITGDTVVTTPEPAPSDSPSPSPSPTSTTTPSPTPSPSPTVEPTPTPSPTPQPTESPSPTPSPTSSATPEAPTPQPTPPVDSSPPPSEPTPTPSPTPQPTSEPSPSPTPSPQPSVEPTPQPQPNPQPAPSTPEPTPEPSIPPTPSIDPIPDSVLPEPPAIEPEPIPNPDEAAPPLPEEPPIPAPIPGPEEPNQPPIDAPNTEPLPQEPPQPPVDQSNSNLPPEPPLPPDVVPEPTPELPPAEVNAENWVPSVAPEEYLTKEEIKSYEAIGLVPNNPNQLPTDIPKPAPAEVLVPHIQQDVPGVENGGIEFFGTKDAPQVVGEDGQLTPPAPAPGSGDPIPPDAITTEDTFIGQPGGTTFNAPDIAVPVLPIEINIDIPGVGESIQAMADAYVALANIGNDMSPITRKKAKKILITTIVVGQISQLRRRF